MTSSEMGERERKVNEGEREGDEMKMTGEEEGQIREREGENTKIVFDRCCRGGQRVQKADKWKETAGRGLGVKSRSGTNCCLAER